MSCLSPTTLTNDEQKLILRATARHPRDHLVISLALSDFNGCTIGPVAQCCEHHLRSSRCSCPLPSPPLFA